MIGSTGIPARDILERSLNEIYVFDADTFHFIEVNEGARRNLGYSTEELRQLTPIDIKPEYTRKKFEALVAPLRSGELDKIDFVTIHRRKDGTGYPVEVHLQFMAYDHTAVFVAIILDITERKRAEEAMRESENHLRSVIQAIPHAVITISDRGTVESFSAAAEALFGYSSREVIGRNVKLLMPEPYRSEHDGYLDRYRETHEKHIIEIGRVVVGRRKGGEVFPMQLSVGEYEAAGGRYFTGIVQDITAQENAERELRTLQEELISATRVSAMGEMGSGIAHELNQPLTAVINYVQACRRLIRPDREPNPEKLQGLMEKAVAQAERAGEIVRRLRTFIGRGDTERSLENANTIVEEACALALSGVSTIGVDVRIDLSPNLPDVLVDRIQVQQVVLNLVRNAVEAMEDVPDKRLTVSTVPTDGDWIEVAVADTGGGLSPEIVKTLFEPFHTTKQTGMGIGLSICRTIIESHEGRIWAETNPGGGTIFRFTLPVIGELDDD